MNTCTWTEDADGNWHTGCNEFHVIIDGTPCENGYAYCPYCGVKIETVLYNDGHDTPPQIGGSVDGVVQPKIGG